MSEYEKMHLTLLRRVGRSKGVKNPSSLKKSELIEEIKKIDKGKATPYFTKRGRPTKQTESKGRARLEKLIEKKSKIMALLEKLETEILNIIDE